MARCLVTWSKMKMEWDKYVTPKQATTVNKKTKSCTNVLTSKDLTSLVSSWGECLHR